MYDISDVLKNLDAINRPEYKISSLVVMLLSIVAMWKIFEKAGDIAGKILCKVCLTPIGSFLFEDYVSEFLGDIGKNIGKFLFEENNKNDEDKKEDWIKYLLILLKT